MKSAISDAGDKLTLATGSSARLLLDAATSAHVAAFTGATGTLELAAGGSLTLDTALAVGANIVKLDDGLSSCVDGRCRGDMSTGTISGAGIITAPVTATAAATITAAGNFLHVGGSITDSGAALTLQVSGGSHLELGGPSSAASFNFSEAVGSSLRYGRSLTVGTWSSNREQRRLVKRSKLVTDRYGWNDCQHRQHFGAGKVAAPVTATGSATIEVNGGALEGLARSRTVDLRSTRWIAALAISYF